MTAGAERLLVLSIRLLKTAANSKFDSERKGVILQKLSAARERILRDMSLGGLSSADKARLALTAYLNKLAQAKTREQI